MQEMSKEGVSAMFDAIASTYDRVNRFMTFGQDMRWRRSMRRFVPSGSRLLDLATGTGDQILALIDLVESAVGIDLADEMLEIGRKKCAGLPVQLVCASALELPFEDASFDVCTMSFGIRNVTDVDRCLGEMQRVLKPGGKALILETGLSDVGFVRGGQLVYLRHVLPVLGRLMSGHGKAYRYLNATVETFPYGKAFIEKMQQCGFREIETKSFMMGNVRLYVGCL